ncbi:VOC family protein [Reichenbachiella sp. MALMAid0571]|uniref:VOC family protein n=1 Tax=Reichenbachiella sp. MALMAid0571 TaxID=3143939 RepID=UPI0032DF29E5
MNFFCFLFSLILLFTVEGFSQNTNPEKKLHLSEVRMMARDVFQSAKWYARHLNFKVTKSKHREFVILENGDFTLHIVTAKQTVTPSQIEMPPNKERINGYYELGFLCNDLDSLMYQYEGREIRRVKELGFDLDYKTKTVVLADPDGNRVKLFQASKDQIPNINYFKANLVSITTSDLETGVRWYQTNLGFQEILKNYSKDSNTTISILRKDDMTIELQELSGRTMEITELLSNQIELTGFSEIILSNNKELVDITDNDGNKLKY